MIVIWTILGLAVCVFVGYMVYKTLESLSPPLTGPTSFKSPSAYPIEVSIDKQGNRVDVYDVRHMSSPEVRAFIASQTFFSGKDTYSNLDEDEHFLRITYK